MNDPTIAKMFLANARRGLRQSLKRIDHCLHRLSEREIWWRPNAASNSAGNLVLHLSGNVRQWIISGLGCAPDVRQRGAEFAARGSSSVRAPGRGAHSRRQLLLKLEATMREADAVLRRLTPEALACRYTIQGFHVTGLEAVADVYSHFTYHTGQIIYLTKLRHGRDLRLTTLPKLPGRSTTKS